VAYLAAMTLAICGPI